MCYWVIIRSTLHHHTHFSGNISVIPAGLHCAQVVLKIERPSPGVRKVWLG